MKRFSLLVKLFMGNLLLVGIVISVGLVVSYRYLNTTYMRDNRAYQDHLAEVTGRYFEDSWPMRPDRIDVAAEKLLSGSRIRLTVIDPDGKVLGDSHADPQTMENHKTPDREEVIGALDGRVAASTRLSKTKGIEYRYVAGPIEVDDRIVALVRLAMPIRVVAEEKALIREALFWAAVAAVAVAAVLALMMSWIWYAPLRQITQTAEQIAGGDLDARARVSGTDELARLADRLNDMRDRLAGQIRTVETQRRQLHLVVENLREGVVALDKTGHVVLINRSAAQLLDVNAEEAVGGEFKSVVRVGGVVELYHRLMAAGEFVDGQVEVRSNGRRILNVHAARVPAASPEGIAVLLVLGDITQIAGAAEMKAEFVANASHELRTPLATLRAAVETLADDDRSDPQTVQKVAEILDRHTTRLEQMTNDLLNLHAAEAPGGRLEVTEISPARFADRIRRTYQATAQNRDIELNVSVNADEWTFNSDPGMLELIADNLLDNAMKFTLPGGKVTVALAHDQDGVTLKISDTGCGIPQEIRDRVFERFFQAEASRSGDSSIRGTGLGLAIVKHAAERLGGTVTLDSRTGEGTTVTVLLPTIGPGR